MKMVRWLTKMASVREGSVYVRMSSCLPRRRNVEPMGDEALVFNRAMDASSGEVILTVDSVALLALVMIFMIV
jgi:hypothetical protein